MGETGDPHWPLIEEVLRGTRLSFHSMFLFPSHLYLGTEPWVGGDQEGTLKMLPKSNVPVLGPEWSSVYPPWKRLWEGRQKASSVSWLPQGARGGGRGRGEGLTERRALDPVRSLCRGVKQRECPCLVSQNADLWLSLPEGLVMHPWS